MAYRDYRVRLRHAHLRCNPISIEIMAGRRMVRTPALADFLAYDHRRWHRCGERPLCGRGKWPHYRSDGRYPYSVYISQRRPPRVDIPF